MSSGWIKLHRSLEHSKLWLSEPFTRGQAWVDILILANHKGGHIRVSGQRIDIARGECGWSEANLAIRWRWSRGKVRRFINELECDQMLTKKTNTRTTILTICNYDKYQGLDEVDGTTDGTTDGHQIVQQTDTNKKGKKGKKGEEVSNPPLTPKHIETPVVPPNQCELVNLSNKLSTYVDISKHEQADSTNGVLKNLDLGKGSYNILHHITDKDLGLAKVVSPSWDIYNLAGVYNHGVPKRGIPKNPGKAFIAWCKAYTGGLPPWQQQNRSNVR